MNKTDRHPEDLTPYLDGDVADPRHAEISRHLESCRACAEEAKIWQKLEDAFRDPAIEIEVPAFQWTRIRARLEQAPALGWRGQLSRMLGKRRLLWSASAGLLLVTIAVAGLQYRAALERGQLTALAGYSQAEYKRIQAAENPFRIAAASDAVNPFAQVQDYANEGNPFLIR
jgi:anti-sigma factor RsiW